jgi:pimeloyl-ACP methyl ester carboxylesterase
LQKLLSFKNKERSFFATINHNRKYPRFSKMKKKVVILIHGLCRSPYSFLMMKKFLEKHGYTVVLFSYNSIKYSIYKLADKFTEFLYYTSDKFKLPLNIVSHSMGGILTRIALGNIDNKNSISIGRIVMLAPPNNGAKAADKFLQYLPPSRILRPLKDLRTTSDSPIHQVYIPSNYEIGIIAGSLDAKVSISESHLPTEKEHLIVNSAHTFIMNSTTVKKAVLTFLNAGTFKV